MFTRNNFVSIISTPSYSTYRRRFTVIFRFRFAAAGLPLKYIYLDVSILNVDIHTRVHFIAFDIYYSSPMFRDYIGSGKSVSNASFLNRTHFRMDIIFFLTILIYEVLT